MTARFFIDRPPENAEVVLDGDEHHHLAHVFRLNPGDEVRLFDREGREYLAEIAVCGKRRTTLRILGTCESAVEFRVEIVLAQALLKSKTWDDLLCKAMELGLGSLRPVWTDYMAAGPDTAGRQERWEKILVAAAKQCGRTRLLPIAAPVRFGELLEKSGDFPLRIMAHNAPSLPTLKAVLDSKPGISKVLAMVGPEGGFSEGEVEQARGAGVRLFTLGPATLRAETAAMAVIANLRFYFADQEVSDVGRQGK